jgi:hypothetical protein
MCTTSALLRTALGLLTPLLALPTSVGAQCSCSPGTNGQQPNGTLRVNIAGTWSETDLQIIDDILDTVNDFASQWGFNVNGTVSYSKNSGSGTVNLLGSSVGEGYPSPYFTPAGSDGTGTIVMPGNYTGTTAGDDSAQRRAVLTNLLLHELGHSMGFAHTSGCS